MEATSQSVLELALQLPESERVRVVQSLLESLSPDIDDPQEESLPAELDRRLAEFEQGQADVISWPELKRQR